MPKPRAIPLAAKPAMAVVVFGGLLCVAVLGMFLIDLRHRHDAAIEEAHRDTQGYAAVLAEHTALTFEVIDRVVLNAIELKHEVADGSMNRDAAFEAIRQIGRASCRERV